MNFRYIQIYFLHSLYISSTALLVVQFLIKSFLKNDDKFGLFAGFFFDVETRTPRFDWTLGDYSSFAVIWITIDEKLGRYRPARYSWSNSGSHIVRGEINSYEPDSHDWMDEYTIV